MCIRDSIKVAVPTEATPELLARLEADKSKRALVAKARSERARAGPPHAFRELFRELKALLPPDP